MCGHDAPEGNRPRHHLVDENKPKWAKSRVIANVTIISQDRFDWNYKTVKGPNLVLYGQSSDKLVIPSMPQLRKVS